MLDGRIRVVLPVSSCERELTLMAALAESTFSVHPRARRSDLTAAPTTAAGVVGGGSFFILGDDNMSFLAVYRIGGRPAVRTDVILSIAVCNAKLLVLLEDEDRTLQGGGAVSPAGQPTPPGGGLKRSAAITRCVVSLLQVIVTK